MKVLTQRVGGVEVNPGGSLHTCFRSVDIPLDAMTGIINNPIPADLGIVTEFDSWMEGVFAMNDTNVETMHFL